MRKIFFAFLFLTLPVCSFAAPEQKPAPAAKRQEAIAWVDRPKAERERIVESWYALPETTRPPFPAFRDSGAARAPSAKASP